MEAVRTYRNRSRREVVTIFPDECPSEGPMDWEQAYQFVTIRNHSHTWGHKQVTPDAMRARIEDAEEAGQEVFPVFAYVHSAVAFALDRSKYPFTCPWDTGQCGVIIVTDRESFGEDIRASLAASLSEYADWCNGNIFGCKREKVTAAPNEFSSPGRDFIDSCGGFIGDPDAPWMLHSAGIAGEDGELLEGWEEGDWEDD